ncbi:MAG: DNA photolyase family protein [Chlamydiales bacterium]|nr:DNA photolyase family protein [Chlamydiales bacterium]
MESHPCIVWLRNDLRLNDNPALYAACATGRPVIVCYIWSEDEEEPYFPGGASRAWLHDSLGAFSESIDKKLILKKGKWLDVLQKLIQESSAQTVYWNRRYEPHYVVKDREVQEALVANGITVETFIGNVLFEPCQTGPSADSTYRVFTSFYKSLQQQEVQPCIPTCTTINHYTGSVQGECLSGLSLLTKNPALDIWQPGEKGADAALAKFIKCSLASYGSSFDSTSRLSAHLHFGELSVRHVAKSVQDHEAFYKELILRDFAIHLLFYFPSILKHPLNPEFESFPWRTDPEQLALWQEGHTGIPIVDAAMRELLATGWMPHDLRVIVGSFLVKQLLISWQQGEAWFWEKFFDADIATNTLGWQMVSGFSTDSVSYYQVTNPALEGQKIDPEARYIKHWLPELHDIDAKSLHNPGSFHVKGYPAPMVDLDFARMRALEAYQEMKND